MCAAITQTTGHDPGSPMDYHYCDLPGSRLRFRGPLPAFDAPFVAVLGGNETFGKFVAQPFPDLISEWIGLPVANLGVAHAGLSLFSEEQVLLDVASMASITVLQVLGAQNMSNRLYSVHSRRNDRFLGVSPALRELYPQVDFTEINFTGHLLETLSAASPASFQVVADELKWSWVQRMRRVLSIIRGDVLLLWVTTPETMLFVDETMIGELGSDLAGVVRVGLGSEPTLAGKRYRAGEEDAALQLPGPADHHRIGEALLPILTDLAERSGRDRVAARPKDQSFSISSGTAVNRSATRP